jgi:predicted nucleic acid-binding protein
MIFVDTSAWFALVVPTDPCQKPAKCWLMQNKIRLITSDYVVDEILTLLKMRGEYARSLSLGESFFEADMDSSGISKAFAFDEHFKQFGNINILPSS